MFTKEFASGRARNYMDQPSFDMSKLGSPIGNSTEISPVLRQRGVVGDVSASRLDQNGDSGMSVSGRRLAAPVGQNPLYYSPAGTYADTLNAWFFSIIGQRRAYATACCVSASAATFIVLNFLLNLSIWAPISSTSDAFFSIFSLKWILLLVLYCTCSAALSWTWSYLMLKVDGNNHISKYSIDNWVVFILACTVELVSNLILWFTSFSGCVANEDFLSAYVFMLLFVMKIAFNHVFSCTFRITQPLKEVNVKSDLMAVLEFRTDAMYRDSLINCLNALKRAVWIFVPLCFVLPVSAWSLFNLRLVFACFVLSFRQLLAFEVAYRCNRIFLTQHIEFTMPTTYTLKEPTEEEKRNIVTGLESTIMSVQVFAFWDLRKLTLGESARRISLYSLSQPGGHPRNWNSVKDACLRAIKIAAGKIEEDNHVFRMKDIAELSERVVLDPNAIKEGTFEIDRTAMLMPPELRMSMHRENARLRLEQSMSSRRFHTIRKIPVVAKAEKFITQIVDYFTEKKKVVTDFEADQAMYAIDCIRALVQYSYNEDRFGVVQKDLSELFTSLLDLQLVADTNIRNKHLRSTNAPVSDYVRNFNSGVLKLEQAANYAISRLASTFKDHMPSLKLSDKHMDVLHSLMR